MLRKQNISLSPPYTIGVLKHEINLYQLYQTVMINGHGGEKVSLSSLFVEPSLTLSSC